MIDFGEAGVKDMMDVDEDEWREIVRFNCEPQAVTALVRAKRVEWRKEFGMPEYDLPPSKESNR